MNKKLEKIRKAVCSIPEAAELLGLSVQRVHVILKDNRFSYFTLGREKVLLREEVEQAARARNQ